MELKEVISESYIESKPDINELYGNNGMTVVSPESEFEISEVLKYANENDLKVSIISGGTKRGFGGIQERYDILLSLANFKGIVEHTVGDMTVTVKPGTTIQELQDHLAEHNQMVSLDPAWPKEATIGGVIAANESGPKRLKYGSARDLVIGLRVVYSDGSIIRTGGKVVKNVAGYDMNKLFIGAMGTLGVISEITMKLRPLPKYESLVLLNMKEDTLDQIKAFAVKLQDSFMEPVSLELINPELSKKMTGKAGYTLAIAFEDVEKAVHYQEEWVKANCPESASVEILSLEKAREYWGEFQAASPNSLTSQQSNQIAAAIKIGSKNMDVLEIIKELPVLANDNVNIEAHGGLGHGLTHVFLGGEEDDIKNTIQEIRSFAENKGGYAVLKLLPASLRNEIDVWGKQPAYAFLFEGMKRKVDPKNTLNFKRFIGGI
jgi:glycolate oxidase FAD binding subunit